MRKVTAAGGSVVFLAFAPLVVAGVVPWLLTRWQPGTHALACVLVPGGVVLIAAGTATLLAGFTRFVVDGVGTPAPIAPTERLVTRGPNRYVRNPMYLAVSATIVGQGLALARPVLLGYAAFAFVLM